MRLAPCLLAAALAGCTPLPKVGAEDAAMRQASYPPLLPLEAILARVPPATPDPAAALAARAAALRARATALAATES
ncbi:MAG: hypothetical protein KDE00_14055 [Rhodobacteraceae bacterium]|nr:hypothetical protein [Paracoccaceae bacterium]